MLLSRGIAGLRSLAEAKEGMLGITPLRSWLYRKKQDEVQLAEWWLEVIGL